MTTMRMDELRLTCLYWQWIQLTRNLNRLQKTSLTDSQRDLLKNATFYANLIHEDLDAIEEME